MDKKQEKRENCQAIMVDKEHLDPYRVSNLPHVLAINNKSSTFVVSRKGLSTCITNVLTKFHSISG